MKEYKSFAIWIAGLFVLTVTVYAVPGPIHRPEDADSKPMFVSSEAQQLTGLDGSYEATQKLFNARCVECHSCNNAPCQLKLTSYEGLQRGTSKIEAIHPTRLQSIPPTRLGIDARSAEEWHKKGFSPVADDHVNLIMPMINPGPVRSPADRVADSHICPANMHEVEALNSYHP